MSKFILSCTTCSLRGVEKDEILSCFKYAPNAGYKHWGIAGSPLWTLGGARWFDSGKVKKMADDAGLQGCTEVYGPQFPTDSIEVAQSAADDMVLLLDVAETLGAPVVVITGGKRRGDAGLEASITGIQRLLPFIEKKQVKLALEPHFGSQFQTREDYDKIFAAINHPQVGITVDTGHFHTAEVDWQQLIRDYKEIHVKDHIGEQSVAIGKGEIDLKALIEVLHEIDYNGALAIELEVTDPENLPRYIIEAHDYLSQQIKEVTGHDPK